MKKELYVVLTALLLFLTIMSGKASAAPSFEEEVYKVEVEEDTPSSLLEFRILYPAYGDFYSLSGYVYPPNTAILSNIYVSRVKDEGNGVSLWRLYFNPVTDKNGTSIIAVTITDGTEYASKDMTVTITPVNDAPILYNGSNDFADMKMPDITDSDMTVSAVRNIIDSSPMNSGNAITDADGDPEGIAVIAVNSAVGAWEYSVNGGADWVQIGNVSETNGLLLGVSDLVRFTRNAGWSGIIPNGLRIKAWDHSDGRQSGDRADTTNYQGIEPPEDRHPFSSNTELVSIKACPTLNTDYCYSADDANNTLASMVNGAVGSNFTAGSFVTAHGNVVIRSDGSFTYTKGATFTCADHFTFTISSVGGCPGMSRTAFVLQPICTGGNIRIDLEDAIRALQIVTGLRPAGN